ncbi:MAG: hypothetical protein LBD29_02800 [Treponema sp.]|jgi:hypothetical protein|nr:hypothetical protein [Treponema sp.]
MLYDKVIESLLDVKKAIKEKLGDDGMNKRGARDYSSGPHGFDRIQYEIDRIAEAIRHSTGGSNGGISDAPSDGKQYARINASWAEVVRGGQYYTIGQFSWCDMVVPHQGTISVTAIPNIGKDILFCSPLTLTVPGGIGTFSSTYLISTMANVQVTLSIGAGTTVNLSRLSDLKAKVTGGGNLQVQNGAWRCVLTSDETSKINISSVYDSELYLDGSSEITVNYGFNSKFYVYGSSSGHLRLKDHKNCEVYDTEFSETRIWCNRAVSSRFYMDYDTSANDKSLFRCDMADDRVIFKDCVFSCISRDSHAGQRRALFKLYDASQVEFLNVEFLRNIVVYDQKESGDFSINSLFNIELNGLAIPKVKFIIDGNKLAFRDANYEGDPVSLIYCTSTAEPDVYNPTGTPAIDYLTFRDNVIVHNTPMDHDQVSNIPLVSLIAVRSYDLNFIQASRNRIYSRTGSNLLVKDAASGSDLLTDTVPAGFLSQSGNYNFSNVPSVTMDRLQELWF